MSRQFGNPRVNASLIREGRMIFQQLSQIFGERSKVDNVYAMRAAQAQAEADIAKAKAEKTHVISLTCEPCIRSAVTTPEPAITVSKGFAVCHKHLLARD